MGQEALIHKWEFAGFGKAPFRVVGIAETPSKSMAEHNPHAYNLALRDMPKGYGIGSCGICGAPLKLNYLIHTADGKKFAVGCECVLKADDGNLTTQMKEEKRRREREKREAKRMDAVRAREDEERERNGGKTDWEIEEEQRQLAKQRDEQIREEVADILAPIIRILEDGKGGFRDDIARDMRKGSMPFGRGWDLVIEIAAKQSGRKGSKPYVEAEEGFRALMTQAEAKLQSLQI